MEIYSLTTTGEQMSHIIRYDGKPRQKIIYYLARVHRATKERILNNVPDANLGDIAILRRNGLIECETGVSL